MFILILSMIWLMNIFSRLKTLTLLRRFKRQETLLPLTRIALLSTRFTLLAIATLTQLGFGLTERPREKLQDLGQHNLSS